MRSSKSRRFAIIAAFVTVFTVCCVFLVNSGSAPPSRHMAGAGADQGAVAAGAPGKQYRARKKPLRERRGGVPAVDSEERWDFTSGAQPISIRLALDEAAVRQADGKDRIVALNPPATSATLAARLSEIGGIERGGTVLPVAYPVGRERSPAARRIVTPDLSVKLDPATADRVAADHGLTVKSRPDFAPGWVIMAAPTAFAALDAMVNLRSARGVASADVLLAAQQSLRALPNDPLVVNQWHLKKTASSSAGTDVNIETIWNYPSATGSRGAGIRVGVVDDGMQTNHPDLAPNADTANDKDWNGNDADPAPGSGDDHGTACAGNAAAKGNNSIGVAGTAPDATLVGMRLIAAATTDLQEAEAMYYLPQLVQIKTNSWGPDDTGDLLEGPGSLTASALRNAAELGRGGKGNIILWAGGNGGGVGDNSNYDGYANSIHTIAIGATTSAGNRASYSEPGSNLVVCAPSNGALGITTVDRTGTNGYSSTDYTSSFGGTSSATPTAAGIVALMLEKNPDLGWRDVQEILIRSAAKIKPADADWVTNAAGISFNHNFGAGLIDATAAVNMAAGWSILPAHANSVSTQSNLSVAVPNNNSSGITRSFDLSSSTLRVEHVTVKLDIDHTARGNLAITLTSPGGMASRLAEVRNDAGDNYENWTFTSVRHWGESAAGTWTLKIADLSDTGNTSGGTLAAAELAVFGSTSVPVNPPPVVRITQPAANQVFSPGTGVTVTVNATDLAAGGAPGSIASVQLLDNEVPIGADSVPPYGFTYVPANGLHNLLAVATDGEGATGVSTSVSFSVVNQSPVITAAGLSSTGQAYSDVPLTVSSVTASDPENDPLQYTYQWQSSTNQAVYSDVSGATSATAPALPGALLRCVVTASDGNSASAPFATASVNLLARPGTSAAAGGNYLYTSGLVLRGADSQVSRPAVIHEFSQGPAGGSAEWIEILTLKDGSLAHWDIQDEAGNILVFADDPVWDGIPAGTLIVIYNGASKDPLLPADDLDPADGRMVLSSNNTTCFDSGLSDGWPPLGNSGDSIYLNDADNREIHSIAYGNSVGATPNVGSVGSGKSAFYTGDTDAGADLAANWTVTTSLTARQAPSGKAAGDLFISEYVEGTSNNKAVEIYNPSSDTVNFATTPYSLVLYSNGSASATATIALTGSIAPNTTYVIKNSSATGAIAGVSSELSSVSVSHNGDDTIVLLKGSVAVDCFGQIGFDPGTAWTSNGITTVDKTLRRKPSVSQGDVTVSNAFDPSVEWDMFDVDVLSGLGSHNMTPLSPPLALAITPATFAENAGPTAASGTVGIPAALAGNLVVNLVSSDVTEATLPATASIPAGSTVSAPFAVAAVDDSTSDGPQSLTVTASAAGYSDSSVTLLVTDDEPSLDGVTPGAANSPLNLAFVTALRSGGLDSPALFRFGNGAVVPAGLTLDPVTGILSGTIAPSNPPGDYLIVIERYNSLGESVSQSYTLTLTTGGGDTYADWIATQDVGALTGMLDDADGDGLANAIENHLGTNPGVPNAGLTEVSASHRTLIFRHSRSNTPAADLVVSYEWSGDLVNWHPSAASSGGTSVTIVARTIEDTDAPAIDLVEVTATATGTPGARVFLRVKAIKP